METTTGHLDFQANSPLFGCGIDVENISRFDKYTCSTNPLPMVFTDREIAHISTLEDQSLGLCATFCCKEALRKAIDIPINFTECELLFNPASKQLRPILSLTDATIPVITDCTVRFFHPQADELLAILYLFGRSK